MCIRDSPCYINFPHSLLLDGLAECLPRDKVVIEILEDAEPDDALLEKVIQLYGLGYRLALDDFTMVSDWDRFLPYIHIIKFDLRSTPQPCICLLYTSLPGGADTFPGRHPDADTRPGILSGRAAGPGAP